MNKIKFIILTWNNITCVQYEIPTILLSNCYAFIIITVAGAELYAKGLVFIITELDLWSYNYMNENKDMFTQDAIDGAKKFLENKNLLSNEQE